MNNIEGHFLVVLFTLLYSRKGWYLTQGKKITTEGGKQVVDAMMMNFRVKMIIIHFTLGNQDNL
jgi:hypothetical protein